VVDISPSCAGSFYLELVSPGDASTAPPATLAPAPGDFFGNMRSGAPSIQPLDLSQSYHGFPNPFDPEKNSLTVEYYLANSTKVTLKLYTVYGRYIRTICDAVIKGPGLHMEDAWDGRNETNYPVKSGVYLVVMEAEDQVTGETRRLVRKVVLLR
jgi:hypothetical protein